MMILLIFTCTLLISQYVSCFTRPEDRVVRHLFHEPPGDFGFGRSERHDRFDLGGNQFNHLGGYGQPENAFNWNENKAGKSLRIFRQSDFVFDEDNEFNDIVVANRPSSNQIFRTSTVPSISRPGGTTVRVPGMGTTRSPCEDRCQATTQFDPVCGDNNVTYTNIYWFRCAQRCGRNINIKYRGSCPRV